MTRRRHVLRRGQAALEYLSTYGFALLALLIAIGVINYLGFFSPNTLRANDCSFPAGIACEDYNMQRIGVAPAPLVPGFEFIAKNEYGVNLTVVDVNMTMSPSSIKTPQGCSYSGGSSDWPIGENKSFTCSITSLSDYVQGQRYEGVIAIAFTQRGGSYTHHIQGVYSVVAQ